MHGGRAGKIELLAPAGNFEKLEIAIHYGADAVYLAGKEFSLRNFSGNFSLEEMQQALAYGHANGIKLYVACNIYPRDDELPAIRDHLAAVGALKPDGVIVADPGIFMLARETIPHIPVHVSTQANTTNSGTARFWQKMGAVRVNVARELNLEEITHIVRTAGIEVEAFVHGAMCISYSGRCLLSSFMARRDANRGRCAHPCRWQYSVVEAQRPGQYMPVQEDARGTYIFNSNDLCMIAHIPEVIRAGITSLKIEGRMKGIHYLASTVKVYREAIDAWYADPKGYQTNPDWLTELGRINNRGYCTGFYFDDPEQVAPNLANHKPDPGGRFVGKVLDVPGSGPPLVEVRNKIQTGDRVEILPASGKTRTCVIEKIVAESGQTTEVAQPGNIVTLFVSVPCSKMDLIRRINLT
jgi:putative protease